MAGVRRVSDITTVPYNVRVLVFHNTLGAPCLSTRVDTGVGAVGALTEFFCVTLGSYRGCRG